MIRRFLIRSTLAWICAVALIILTQANPAHAAPSDTAPGVYVTFVEIPHVEQSDAPAAIAQALTPTSTPTPQSTLSAPTGLISPTATLTPTATVTGSQGLNLETESDAENDVQDEQPAVRRTTVVTSQPLPTRNATATPTATLTAEESADTEGDEESDADETGAETGADELDDEAEPLVGTIITNHTDYTTRFFIEGQTLELAASRATSFELARGTTVLNLYNCAASTPETNEDCYWDPYILQRDGFYEVYESRAAGVNTVARLMLRAADSPPTDQIWIQNRTSNIEAIVFRNEVIEIVPAAVHELPVEAGMPAILYVRSCIVIDGQSACEWRPKTLDAGIYYALAQTESAGGLANSTVLEVDLRPVIGGSADATETTAADSNGASDEVVCHVQVPTLNIRSGPGLQYQIIGKIFSTDSEPGAVVVVGRNSANQWLVVDPEVMPEGWITASESFVLCEGDFTELPLVEAPPLPVEPPPAPAVVVTPEPTEPQQPEDETGIGEGEGVGEGDGDQTEIEGEPIDDEAIPPAQLPEGYALLLVHNGFDQVIRFTLDQQYRVELAPSEIDLQPGESTNIVVYPGNVAFSVSTPWGGGISDNALIQVESDEAYELWLRFDFDGSDSWDLNW